MGDLVHQISSKIFTPDGNPASTVSIKVQRKALKSAVNNSIRKRDWLDRNIPVRTRRRISVEAAECGTSDSIFFAPERPNVNQSHQRVSATEFVKINPNEHNDVVRLGDDFEISFIGMSVAIQDAMGNNELLLCSLARKEDCIQFDEVDDADQTSSPAASSTIESASPVEDKDGQGKASAEKPVKKPFFTPLESTLPKKREIDLSDLPTALPIRPGDIPFVHYDPETDGHDTGTEPDTFVSVPGTKRLFVRRKGSAMDQGTDDVRDVVIRFTVIEIDMLSEEQLIAVRSLEEVAKSVGKAASSVPYLKFISWLLKFANTLGRSALKKVSKPDHVMSMDLSFILAPDDDPNGPAIQREEYGNYLRFGYYFFLSSPVDAKLYAQTGASSQNVQLLLRRYRYNPKNAKLNEKEFFPLTGVSYVVVKVTRGCSPYNVAERSEMFARHRGRLIKLLKKYTGTLGSVTTEGAAADVGNDRKDAAAKKRRGKEGAAKQSAKTGQK